MQRLLAVLFLLLVSSCTTVEGAWTEAATADDIGAYRKFLTEYRRSPYASRARTRIQELELAAAIETGSMAPLVKFLKDNRDSPLRAQATTAIESLTWQRTCTENTVAAYQLFQRAFPSGPNTEEAARRLEELHWQTANDANFPAALREFLAQHVSSSHAEEARQKLGDLEWAAAREAGTSAGFSRFVVQHPDSTHVVAAREAILDLDWKAASTANAVRAYEQFRKRHPQSVHDGEAVQRIEACQWQTAVDAEDPHQLRLFLATHPDTDRLEEGRRRIEQLVWSRVEGRPSTRILEEFLAEFPQSSHGVLAREMLAVETGRWEVTARPPVQVRHAAIREGVDLSAVSVTFVRGEETGEVAMMPSVCHVELQDGRTTPLVALVLTVLPDRVSAILRGRSFGGAIELGEQKLEGRSSGAPYAGKLDVLNIGGSLSIDGGGGISSSGLHQLEYRPSDQLERSAPLPGGRDESGLLVSTFHWTEDKLANREGVGMFLLANGTRDGGGVFSLLAGDKIELALVFVAKPEDIRALHVAGRTIPVAR